jgi:hypothetical protein
MTGGLAVDLILFNAATPSAGWHRSSSIISPNVRPSTPPARLISSTANSAPLRAGIPQCAASPVNGSTAPIVIGPFSAAMDMEVSHARPQALAQTAAKAAAATDLMTICLPAPLLRMQAQ